MPRRPTGKDSSTDRRVSLGKAGIFLGRESSRLARNSADWHQLLELCGMTGTLICDEDGLYDPRNFNDRLLLGLKGAPRRLNSISSGPGCAAGSSQGPPRRVEHRVAVGLARRPQGTYLDPDTAVQGAMRRLFTTFEATGSASACVKAFNTAR